MYNTQRQIEQLLETYPLSQLPIDEHGYIPGSSDYRIVLHSRQHLHIFIFRNCIEMHQEKPETASELEGSDVDEMNEEHLEADQRTSGEASGEEQLEEEREHDDVAAAEAQLAKLMDTPEQEPEWEYVEYSARVSEWNLRLPIALHEVEIRTTTDKINLIFSHVEVSQRTNRKARFQELE